MSSTQPRARLEPKAAANGQARRLLYRLLAELIGRVLGSADGSAVGIVAARELRLILRSREWHRFVGMWLMFGSGLLLVPILFRSDMGRWRSPSDLDWLMLLGYALQIGVASCASTWTMRRLRRDLYTNRLDELMLTRCSAADIAMGEALASACAMLWLVAASFPICLLFAAVGGQGGGTAVRLVLSLAPAAALGVWFGMGWGLAFTLRRTSALVPLTQWWILGPFLPILIGWMALGFFPIFWAILGFFRWGTTFIAAIVTFLLHCVQVLLRHFNPLLTVGGAVGIWGTTWLTDWLTLVFVAVFMMRKSMDVIQAALGTVHEPVIRRSGKDYWIHHDGHYFDGYSGKARREPNYRDGGNAIAAFDEALGHRVFVHPVFWAAAYMAYLFMLGWSLMLPRLGMYTGMAAVLTPATGALLLMSGGVAISFGWERDQHRWPALAVLPIDNFHLALGKIKGVVRPTLWLCLAASGTAVLLGMRGAMHPVASYWMALHVLLFPVALAFVSATLALTTPTLGEALYRWAVLGAIPCLAYLLPYPIGSDSGLALPMSPPLLVLILVARGPAPELLRGAWISLGLEVLGIAGSLLIMRYWLRQWTVGEKD